jgi:hypothetical protein
MSRGRALARAGARAAGGDMSWYLISVEIVGTPASLVMPSGTHKMIGSFGTEQACKQAEADVRRNYDAMGIKDTSLCSATLPRRQSD